jgi:hypothetical protein
MVYFEDALVGTTAIEKREPHLPQQTLNAV